MPLSPKMMHLWGPLRGLPWGPQKRKRFWGKEAPRSQAKDREKDSKMTDSEFVDSLLTRSKYSLAKAR